MSRAVPFAMSGVVASGLAASAGYTSGRCNICGKLLKSSAPEAMAAHQRELSSCIPPPSKGNVPKALKLGNLFWDLQGPEPSQQNLKL